MSSNHHERVKHIAREFHEGDHVTITVKGKRVDGAVCAVRDDPHLGRFYDVAVGEDYQVSRYGREMRAKHD